jgi:hypothetical protein
MCLPKSKVKVKIRKKELTNVRNYFIKELSSSLNINFLKDAKIEVGK